MARMRAALVALLSGPLAGRPDSNFHDVALRAEVPARLVGKRRGLSAAPLR